LLDLEDGLALRNVVVSSLSATSNNFDEAEEELVATFFADVSEDPDRPRGGIWVFVNIFVTLKSQFVDLIGLSI